ncbi:uncharacterized protein BP5553_09682 [Venustampulla echinocandica]|uniref:Aminoglycoside phosphotransferase domain-containing protein n=1 Tax=Venustampulla echinocandica TaxID=2656787 RepID=A0A370TBQ1_9HELO|nr:uncharacterized protein BP5553_09682 [Venustampulla echinocandica]RDL31473.1 hypothetical protein BP5553_09682 [Venustampulla echinocandica]
MASKERVIIQLRTEPLDVEIFQHARRALGDVVPDIAKIADEALESEGIWPYYMTFMPGETWRRSRAFDSPVLTTKFAKSLGGILSRGFVSYDDGAVVDTAIKVQLKRLQAAMNNESNEERADQIKPFRGDIQRMLDSADRLKVLPLFISHADLNHMNILISETSEVSGIVDWELSSDLPFGMGCYRVHDLVGRYRHGEFRMLEGFEDGERGFWEAVFEGLPMDIRRVLDANLNAVQFAVHVGTLLGTLDLQGDHFNHAALKALPKFLSYRIPALRGQDPPYAK